MTPVTHVSLILSYVVFAIATAILPVSFADVDQGHANLAAVVVFFSALHIHQFLTSRDRRNIHKERLEKLEDKTVFLRTDLEKTKRAVDGHSETKVNKDTLVTELKVLQTLIEQVVKKEGELRVKSASIDVEVPEHRDAVPVIENHVEATPLELDDDQVLEVDIPQDDIYISSEMDDVDNGITNLPSRESTSGSLIRVVQDEQQLFSVIQSSLSENRVDLYLQPIIAMSSRNVAHYECFSRVRDENGNIILPRQYLKLAEEEGLIGTIDNLLLFRLIQLVRRLGPRRAGVSFVCNMSKYSMNDQDFFPQFVDFMMSHEEFTGRFVFEISQKDYFELDNTVKGRLQSLGRRGFGFSLDQVSDLDLNYDDLGRNYFKFIKADALPLLRERGSDMNDFKAMLRRNGMELIASRVEDEAMAGRIADAGLEYAQGYHFGEPALPNSLDQNFQ
jgi:cyclic-di-GMP phosphodiesterase TipF (flagellum assembly factor)